MMEAVSVDRPAPRAKISTDRDAMRRRTWRFVSAGLAITVVFGSLVGAIAVASTQVWFSPLPRPLILGHAFGQLFGFVLLVAMGVGLRLLPPSPWSRREVAERALLGFATAGAALRLLGYLAATAALDEAVAPLALAGAGALLVAAVLFGGLVGSGFARRPISTALRTDLAALAALAFLLLATVLDAVAAVDLATRGAPRPGLMDRVYAAFIDGFAASLIVAILSRMGTLVTGSRVPEQWPKSLAILAPAGAAVITAAGPGTGAAAVGAIVWAAGMAVLAAPLLVPGTPAKDRATALWVRAALAWLLAGAGLRVFAAATTLAGGLPHQLLSDAARHALVLGFLTQLILAMLARLVQAFEGVDLRFRRLRLAGGVLLNVSVAMRLAQVAAAYWWPGALHVSGASGGVAWLGIVLLAVPVVDAMRTTSPKQAC
jgi:hypothetical protein